MTTHGKKSRLNKQKKQDNKKNKTHNQKTKTKKHTKPKLIQNQIKKKILSKTKETKDKKKNEQIYNI